MPRKNVLTSISKDGRTLTCSMDMTEEHGESASGKSVIVATTGRAIPVGENLSLQVNLYKSAK